MSVELAQYAPFSAEVAKGTGLDFYTVEGWIAAEGGPTGNPLNLNPGRNYGSQHAAAVATIQNLKTPIYHGVMDAAHASYKNKDAELVAEAHAIAYSPWKGNDGLPRPKYEQNIHAGALRAIFDNITPATTYTPDNPAKPNDGGLQTNPVGGGNPFSSITDPFAAVARFFEAIYSWTTNPESWKKVGFGVAGFVLIVGGLFIVVRG